MHYEGKGMELIELQHLSSLTGPASSSKPPEFTLSGVRNHGKEAK
jgi:hypothetical protein